MSLNHWVARRSLTSRDFCLIHPYKTNCLPKSLPVYIQWIFIGWTFWAGALGRGKGHLVVINQCKYGKMHQIAVWAAANLQLGVRVWDVYISERALTPGPAILFWADWPGGLSVRTNQSLLPVCGVIGLQQERLGVSYWTVFGVPVTFGAHFLCVLSTWQIEQEQSYEFFIQFVLFIHFFPITAWTPSFIL